MSYRSSLTTRETTYILQSAHYYTFKAIHGLAPTYISELIKVKEQSRYNLRSNQELLLAVPPTRFLPTLGARSFSSAAPYEWNHLSTAIRNITPYTAFKKHLKTLFRQAYNL